MTETQQKGSALLTALFIITLVAIVTTAMSMRLQLAIHRIRMISTTDQLHLAAEAVTFWAMDRLMDPRQSLKVGTSKVLAYPRNLQQIVPTIQLSGQIIDLQTRFNINNLYETNYQPIFFGLLSQLNIGTASFERKNIMDAIINWIKPLHPNDARHDEWSDRYARLSPPYLSAHLPMRNISELRLVYGITPKRYRELEPFVTALPETTAININTSSKKVLLSLGEDIKNNDLDHILNERKQKPYKDIAALTPFLEKYHIQAEALVVESHYFLVVTQAQDTEISLRTYTLLKRVKDKTGLWHVSILSKSINTQ